MSTYTKILYQLVFGSKGYTSFLTAENQKILFPYIGAVLRNKKCHPHIVGGYGNHIHIVFDLHPTVALASIVKDIKKASHEMMLQKRDVFLKFPGWQVGYGGFTYSYKSKGYLIRYVQNQYNHHRKISFKEELIAYYRNHGIDFDEKYLLE
jgi:REP element-mobilizing transposase RayT